MGGQGLCEKQQAIDCVLNFLSVENSECSQTKTNTGIGHIRCYELETGNNETEDFLRRRHGKGQKC